ncbi:MAG: hypothetical protein ACRDUB_19090 [Mycobacterium sp.]
MIVPTALLGVVVAHVPAVALACGQRATAVVLATRPVGSLMLRLRIALTVLPPLVTAIVRSGLAPAT